MYASLSLARWESRLARRESRLTRRETRGGNLLLSGTVSCFAKSLVRGDVWAFKVCLIYVKKELYYSNVKGEYLNACSGYTWKKNSEFK